MTQAKAHKAAVRSYANEHNLSYTQALATLGSHPYESGSAQNPGVAVPRREGDVPFTSLSRTAIVTITAEEITARCGQAPGNVAECAREWWTVRADQQPRIERLIAILKGSSGLILGDWDVDPEADYGPEGNIFPLIDPTDDDLRRTKGKRLTGVQGQQGRIYSLDLRQPLCTGL